ncbi:hypothetical protein [Pinirhizobacter sp.]|jgi:hypothetical protein|uniref:hypothetical protein n=1 Tax=Pinirhizobacter sp. TaxID=2950432 RepID=UPI002F4104B4
MRLAWAAAGACALIAMGVPAPGRAEDAHALVAKALSAMGQGRDLHTVAQLKRTTTSVNFDIVEFDHADAPYVFSGARRQTIVDDLHGQRRMSDEAQLAASAGPPPYVMRTLEGKDGEVGEMVVADKAARSWHMEAPMAWQTDEPIAALLLAEQAGDLKQESDSPLHGIAQHVVSFHQEKSPVRIYLDAHTNLPSAIETTRSWHRATSGDLAWNAWGDITDRVELMNYALGEGVRYPGQSDTFRNGVHLRAAVIDEVHFDNAVDDKAFAMKSTPPPMSAHNVDDLALGEAIGMAPDPKRPIREIAPGVVQIPGSWYSTIVRQDDGLVIIDAPISAGYSRRVLDEAARRFPGMKVKALITSTAFYWHIAGVREYVARGIPIYVRDRNVAVIRALAAAPHSLLPDALARAPRTPDIRPVSGPVTLGKGVNAITVMPVPDGEQPMLMSSIPGAHLLHTGEMVQPLGPGGSLLYPESLLELTHSVQAAGIDTHGLSMIGMHMSPTPWTTLESTLQSSR